MLAINRRFDHGLFSMLKTYIIITVEKKTNKQKHNKLSISLSKADAGNMKKNIIMFIITIMEKERMYNNSYLQSVIEMLIMSILVKRMNVLLIKSEWRMQM